MQQILAHEPEDERRGRDDSKEHESHDQWVDDAVKHRSKAEPETVERREKRRAHEGQDQKYRTKDKRPGPRALPIHQRPQADDGENRGEDYAKTARRASFGHMAAA